MAGDDRTVGFVYVLTNPAFPDLVKVGETGLLAEDRAKDLYETGVPEPYQVAFMAMTSHRKRVEAKAHERLGDRRPNPGREFFRVTADVAIEAVRLAMVEAAGITSWLGSQRHYLQEGDRIALTLEAGQTFALISYPDMGNLLAGRAEIIDLWQAQSDGDVLEIFVATSAGHVAGFATDDPGALSDPLPYLDRSKQIANGMLNGRERLMPGERLLWLPSPEQAQSQVAVLFEAHAYVQVLSRTWSLRRDDNGNPLLFNFFAHNETWPEAVRDMRKVLQLPAPRSWAPRENRGADWVPIGLDEQPPSYWLPQLNPRPKKPRR